MSPFLARIAGVVEVKVQSGQIELALKFNRIKRLSGDENVSRKGGRGFVASRHVISGVEMWGMMGVGVCLPDLLLRFWGDISRKTR